MEKSNVFLLSILLMASLFSISKSLTLFNQSIDRVIIRGTVYCSLNGDPCAPPVSNATVYYECAGVNTTLAQAVTDSVGVFTIVLNTIGTVLVNPSYCVVRVNLPSGTCEIYPPDGILIATVNLFSITINGLLYIANYAVGAFLDPS